MLRTKPAQIKMVRIVCKACGHETTHLVPCRRSEECTTETQYAHACLLCCPPTDRETPEAQFLDEDNAAVEKGILCEINRELGDVDPGCEIELADLEEIEAAYA